MLTYLRRCSRGSWRNRRWRKRLWKWGWWWQRRTGVSISATELDTPGSSRNQARTTEVPWFSVQLRTAAVVSWFLFSHKFVHSTVSERTKKSEWPLELELLSFRMRFRWLGCTVRNAEVYTGQAFLWGTPVTTENQECSKWNVTMPIRSGCW